MIKSSPGCPFVSLPWTIFERTVSVNILFFKGFSQEPPVFYSKFPIKPGSINFLLSLPLSFVGRPASSSCLLRLRQNPEKVMLYERINFIDILRSQ